MEYALRACIYIIITYLKNYVKRFVEVCGFPFKYTYCILNITNTFCVLFILGVECVISIKVDLLFIVKGLNVDIKNVLRVF